MIFVSERIDAAPLERITASVVWSTLYWKTSAHADPALIPAVGHPVLFSKLLNPPTHPRTCRLDKRSHGNLLVLHWPFLGLVERCSVKVHGGPSVP